jgi:hypothetical protein
MTYQAVTHTPDQDPNGLNWAGSPYPIVSDVPPVNALTVHSWASLPPARGIQAFKITNPSGAVRTMRIEQHRLQVLLGLMNQPVRCASFARISQYVGHLKHDHGVLIHTERYDSNAFGIYFLVSKIERIKGGGK